MIQNYHYFIALAEEGSIAKAAERLYVSHQGLSKYLKTLEAHYGVTLFNRKPHLSLTPAGQMVYDTVRQIEILENNLEARLSDYSDSDSGTLRLGATEGRFRILIPELLVEFQEKYPRVELITECANSNELREMLLNNQLDLMITASSPGNDPRIAETLVMNEQLYLIISDNMLKQYFPDRYPGCKEVFRKGADLREFQHVPFILNEKGFSSRDMVDAYASASGITIRCIREIVQADIHSLLSARDYGASFCFSMFLPGISASNALGAENSGLNIFPLSGFDTTNPVRLLYLKGKLFPAYGHDLISLIRKLCRPFMNPPSEI